MTDLQNGMVKAKYNPGQIIGINDWPRWQTRVGPFELELDIVTVGQSAGGEQLGIASFVVMEQEQPFLAYAGQQLATAIAASVPTERLLLLTAETKGAHLVPWVWRHLAALCGDRLVERVITLRKGDRKAYMHRPVRVGAREVSPPRVSYRSITSTSPQHLTMAPRDVELLLQSEADTTAVFVDDFIGQGGTVVGVSRLLAQLGLAPPRYVAVIGSDGSLYADTLAREQLVVTLLPHPFPLVLPTFQRLAADQSWWITT